MPVIDMHSHWATRRGYPLQSEAELAQQERTWRSRPAYRTEAEMAEDFRARRGARHPRFRLQQIPRAGNGASAPRLRVRDAARPCRCDPRPMGAFPGRARRARARRVPPLSRSGRGGGFVGLAVSGSGGLPASDPAWDPFYGLCIEARAPALIFVGTTGLGAGLPGGMGITLDACHPRHLDAVAARFADLTIIAARPAWPWQSEMIAILLHKPNVWCELHGWSPQILHRRTEARDPAPPRRAGHVRGRLSAVRV